VAFGEQPTRFDVASLNVTDSRESTQGFALDRIIRTVVRENVSDRVLCLKVVPTFLQQFGKQALQRKGLSLAVSR